MNQHSKHGGKKPFFATLDEAKQNCKSYYEANGQLRDCTCGTCPNHPQQQEGWREKWKRIRDEGVDQTMGEFYDRIEAFIQSILDQKAREIERLKKDERFNGSDYYKEHKSVLFNEALDQALSILKEE